MKAIGIIVLAVACLVLPLHLWRSLYPQTDWAALALLPLALGIFAGWFAPAAAMFRARMTVAIRETSFLARWMTGRLGAVLGALIFTALAIPVLAWQALSATPYEVMGLIGLCAVASGLCLGLRAFLGSHMTAPFARAYGNATGALVAALVFLPVLAWLNWRFAAHPGAFRTATLEQAVMLGIQALPARRGPIAELLSLFYAFDAAKLWLAIQFSSSQWIPLLFSVDAALVAFLAARASVALTDLVQQVLERPQP